MVETSDFSDNVVIPVGEYVNPFREILKVNKKDDGSVTVTLGLSGGFHSINNGGTAYGTKTKFPLKYYASSTLFSQKDRPGKTSSLALYLKAAGIETKGRTVGEMLELVPDTLNTPLIAGMGRTDKAVQQAGGAWLSEGLKTKDFLTGQDENGNPVYATEVSLNGRTFQAKAKVSYFRSIE